MYWKKAVVWIVMLAGNDKMLLRRETQQYMPLGSADSVNANAARTAAKNMIYALAATQVTAWDYEKINQ